MTVKIDPQAMRAIGKAADDVRGVVKDCASTLADPPGISLPGFLIQDAVERTQKRFAEKADWCARRWEYFGWAIDETAKDMRKRDEQNAAHLVPTRYEFLLPRGGPGVRN